MARTSSNYDHFFIIPSSVTLTFNLPEQIIQMTQLATPQGTQPCQIILKFMHKRRRYGTDKLNL